MRLLSVAVGGLAILAAGCSQPAPNLVGGKPVAHWLVALHSADAQVRKNAVFRLGHVGAADGAALPALLNALHDPAPAVRCQAIVALAQRSGAAGEAIPVLAELQQRDQSAQVRSYAARALVKLRTE